MIYITSLRDKKIVKAASQESSEVFDSVKAKLLDSKLSPNVFRASPGVVTRIVVVPQQR